MPMPTTTAMKRISAVRCDRSAGFPAGPGSGVLGGSACAGGRGGVRVPSHRDSPRKQRGRDGGHLRGVVRGGVCRAVGGPAAALCVRASLWGLDPGPGWRCDQRRTGRLVQRRPGRVVHCPGCLVGAHGNVLQREFVDAGGTVTGRGCLRLGLVRERRLHPLGPSGRRWTALAGRGFPGGMAKARTTRSGPCISRRSVRGPNASQAHPAAPLVRSRPAPGHVAPGLRRLPAPVRLRSRGCPARCFFATTAPAGAAKETRR